MFFKFIFVCFRRAFYNRPEKKFMFFAGQRERNNRLVCEAGYLIMMGLLFSANASDANSQWVACKRYVREGITNNLSYSEVNAKEGKMAKAEGERSVKFNDAQSFISGFAKKFGDKIPSKEGMINVYDGDIKHYSLLIYISGAEDVFVAPYYDVKSFFEEYVHMKTIQHATMSEVAAKTTFAKALASLSNVRMMQAKGHHNTCEVCNTANELLRHRRKLPLIC